MTWRFAKVVNMFVLVILTGCASVSPPPKLKISSPFKKSPRNLSRESEKDVEVKERSREETPKRQPLIARRSNAPGKPQHDAATRRLIENELRDATPSEREEWMKYLATIDSGKVYEVLQSRRTERGLENSTDDSIAETKTSSTPTETHREIQRVGHSVQSESNSKDVTKAPDQKELAQAETSTSSENESAPQQEQSSPEEPTTRNWSGQLKSLTEWEKNPLNFGREENSENTEKKRDRRSKPLPQIISIPFRNNDGSDKKGEKQPSRARTVLFEKEEQTTPIPPSDSLRIAPGAKLWEEELHKLISLMEAEASASGSSSSGSLSRDELRQQVALRMLYLVNDQKQLAMQPIPGLQPADQEFWTSIFWGLSNYLNEEGIDPTERSTITIDQLRSATHYLQIAAKLQLRNVSFCSRINGFGNFEPIDSTQLAAGQPVLIYCDVRNFQSEPSLDNAFITKLRSSVEIYQGDLNGQLVDRSSFPATEDRCQSIRTDYYNSYRIDLPTHLSPGPHILKLTVYDEFSGKSATETIGFTVQ